MPNTDQSEFTFGPGSAWAVLNQYMDGTTPTVLQPRKFDVMQDISINFSVTVKQLMGQLIYARAVGISEGKVAIKIRMGRFDSGLWQMRWGESAGTSGGMYLMFDPEGTTLPTIPGSGPYTITPTVPSSGTWYKDWGVFYGDTGLPLAQVASGPTTGQYSVSAGVYTFAAADTGRPVKISYEYSVTSGVTLNMLSHLQGQFTLTSLRYQGQYGGRYVGLYIPYMVGSTVSMGTKEGDFTIPEMDFEAFVGPSGTIASLYLLS